MKYRVMRDCCTSGNCFHCSKYGVNPAPHGYPARIEHIITEDKQIAKAIADAWKNYNAAVVEITETDEREKAIEYINAAQTPEERAIRKTQMHTTLYGRKP